MKKEFYLGLYTQTHSVTKQERLVCNLDVNDNIITLVISLLDNNTFTIDYLVLLNISRFLDVEITKAIGLLSKAIEELKRVDNRSYNFGFNLPKHVENELKTIVKKNQL